MEAPLDAVDDGNCKCEGILNPTSQAKKKIIDAIGTLSCRTNSCDVRSFKVTCAFKVTCE